MARLSLQQLWSADVIGDFALHNECHGQMARLSLQQLWSADVTGDFALHNECHVQMARLSLQPMWPLDMQRLVTLLLTMNETFTWLSSLFNPCGLCAPSGDFAPHNE